MAATPILFDENLYLDRNPDVREAAERGDFRDGYDHWLQFGQDEWRAGKRAPPVDLDSAAAVAHLGDGVYLAMYDEALGILGEPVVKYMCDDEVRRVTLRFESNFTSHGAQRQFYAFIVTPTDAAAVHEMHLQFSQDNRTHLQPVIIREPEVRWETSLSNLLAVRDALEAAVVEATGESASKEAVQHLMRVFALKHGASADYVDGRLENCRLFRGLGLLLDGWALNTRTGQGVRGAEIVRNSDLKRFEVGSRIVRTSRTDVLEVLDDKLSVGAVNGRVGWAVLADDLDEPDAAPEDYSILMRLDSTETVSWPLPALSERYDGGEGRAVIQRALHYLDPESPEMPSDVRHLVHPVLSWMRAREDKETTAHDRVYGEQRESPVTSVVIPIYGRTEFIEHQLLAFANDPDMLRHEVIYYVDDPRLNDRLPQAFQDLYDLYRVPFRVIFGSRNIGFGPATNAGARRAQGEYLLLLNSDVVPSEAGWIGKMTSEFASLPDAGVLGIRLLYGNDTIQHSGMAFERFPAWQSLYGNYHPFKGLPATLVETDQRSRVVEAVTGACMLCRRVDFDDLGGFNESFLVGDFEDSDLCLRFADAGKRIYYAPQVSAYHLERQSLAEHVDTQAWKYRLTVYNCWLQNEIWGDKISEYKDAVRQQNSEPK